VGRIYIPSGITPDDFVDELIERGRYSCKSGSIWAKAGSRMCVVRNSDGPVLAMIDVSEVEIRKPRLGKTKVYVATRSIIKWEKNGIQDMRHQPPMTYRNAMKQIARNRIASTEKPLFPGGKE